MELQGSVSETRPDFVVSSRPLYRFAIVPSMTERLPELAELAEPEDWNYRHTPSDHEFPILYNYLHHTFARLEEETKVAVSSDGEHACWNSGLVTVNQEPIFLLFDRNLFEGDSRPWHFREFRRKGEHHLNYFEALPEMADYFDDPTCLVLDTRFELRANIEHIIAENRERFPIPYRDMSDYQLQTVAGERSKMPRNECAGITRRQYLSSTEDVSSCFFPFALRARRRQTWRLL